MDVKVSFPLGVWQVSDVLLIDEESFRSAVKRSQKNDKNALCCFQSLNCGLSGGVDIISKVKGWNVQFIICLITHEFI